MKSIYDGYHVIGQGERAFFIGANTGRGFVNASADVFSEGRSPDFDRNLDRLTILKGGAGTGKSTLLKKAAKEAEKRGLSVERYRCGSDYESLDGVVIDGRVGMVDGTSPHVWEMKIPGACSSNVDMSKFLDGAALAPQREELILHTKQKGEAYASAYRYLRGAEVLENEMTETVAKAADFDKLRAYAERTAKKLSGRMAGTGTVRSVYVGSVSMRGLALLPTLTEAADRVIAVEDVYGFASVFLRELGAAFVKRGQHVIYGMIPINDKPKQLYLPELKLTFDVNGEGGSRINLERFLIKERYSAQVGRLKLTLKCIRSMVDEAIGCLAMAGEAHFALEKINVAAMDFKGLNRTCTRVISEIMEKLTTS